MTQSPLTPELLSLRRTALEHPDVQNARFFTTPQGGWRLRVQVRPGTKLPIEELSNSARVGQIVFDDNPSAPPEARPAYPKLGE